MQKSSAIVIDANVAIWAILPSAASFDVLDWFIAWRRASIELHAPSLWLEECTSVIRHYVYVREISTEVGILALDDLAQSNVMVVPSTLARCRAALDWADKLGQRRAYDGFYFSLAAELGAHLYTGDKPLVNRSRQLGLGWVKWIGDPTPSAN